MKLKALKNKWVCRSDWPSYSALHLLKEVEICSRSLARRWAGILPHSSRGKQKNTEASHQIHTFFTPRPAIQLHLAPLQQQCHHSCFFILFSTNESISFIERQQKAPPCEKSFHHSGSKTGVCSNWKHMVNHQHTSNCALTRYRTAYECNIAEFFLKAPFWL